MRTDQHSIGIFITDAQLSIISWDDWLAEVTGISATEAKGKSLLALFPDMEQRGMLARFQRVLTEGVVEVLAPTFHHYLFACAPTIASRHFDTMQQHATLAPLHDRDAVVGVMVTVEDVTPRLERERELAEQLTSPHEATRVQAAQALAELEALASTPSLMEALGDESWRVRKLAVDGLARHGGAEIVAPLLRALREEHRNLSVLNSALQVLALSGVDMVAPLQECLTDTDADLRIYAAQALGDMLDPRAIPALLRALEDEDANVRYHTIEALGKLRAAEAQERLLTLAESGDFYLAFPALDALMKIGDSQIAPRLVPLLEDDMLRASAASVLGHLGDEETVAPLVGLLNRPQSPAQTIAQALAALYDRYEERYREGSLIADLARRELSATGEQNLLDALNEASGDGLRALALVAGWMEGEAIERALTRLLGRATARREVVEALVRYGTRVTELLIEQLASDDLETRQAALLALARIGDARAVPALLRLLDGDDELRIAAAGALAKIGDHRAFEGLLDWLGHPQTAVRQAIIAAINSLGHPEMADRAVRLLQDADPRVRESAVKIAGYFGYRQCLELLIERCHDDDENVRRAALEHLPYLEDERTLVLLAEALETGTPKVRASAAQALAQMDDPQALQYLLLALKDADPWVRYFAARSIGRQGFTESLTALAELAKTDAANPVRIAAIESLARIGGARAAAVLAPLVETEEADVARAALNGLGCIGHPDALPPLLAALRSSDPARRVETLGALGERGGEGVVKAIEWTAAGDTEASVVQAAIAALAHLATPEALDSLIRLSADPQHSEACIEALAQVKSEHLEEFKNGLTQAETASRLAIVEALGRMKQPQASELLSAALDDEAAIVRVAAIKALTRLGSRDIERKLVALARTDTDAGVRQAAQRALRN